MGSFGETTSKEACFSLYVEKGKLFLQLFWTLRFTMVAKKNILSEEFLLPWKKPGKMWCGKTRLQVTSYELTALKHKLKFKSAISNPQVSSSNPWAQIHELRVQIQSYKFKSTTSRIFKPVKTQVNSLKSSSFPNIPSLKSFGNSWGNSSVQFLVIISCFTFTLFQGWGFRRKQYE